MTIASTTMAVFKENFLKEVFEIGPNYTPVTVTGGIDNKSKTFVISQLALVPSTGMTVVMHVVYYNIIIPF